MTDTKPSPSILVGAAIRRQQATNGRPYRKAFVGAIATPLRASR